MEFRSGKIIIFTVGIRLSAVRACGPGKIKLRSHELIIFVNSSSTIKCKKSYSLDSNKKLIKRIKDVILKMTVFVPSQRSLALTVMSPNHELETSG